MELTARAFGRADAPPTGVDEVSRGARRAEIVLAGAATFGFLTAALFFRAAVGLNLLLWAPLAVVACVASVRPRRVSRVTIGITFAALLLAASVVRYAGAWSFAIAVPGVALLLSLLPPALRDETDFRDVARLPLLALSSLAPREVAGAIRVASRIPASAFGAREGARGLFKGLALGLPVALVFTALLASDVDFSRLLFRLATRASDGASFGLFAFVVAASALVGHARFQRAPASTTSTHTPLAYRHAPLINDAAAAAVRAPLAPATWLMVVGQVVTVFALFVGVNLRHLFGGDREVRAPGSLTYARYLHAGFGELLVASVLAVCLIAVGHRLLRPRGEGGAVPGARVPGGALLVAAELSLIALTAVTVASCAQRLAIYEDAYGATRQRLGVGFILAAVLAALALTLVKVLRRGWNGYAGSLAVAAVALTVAASWWNADASVARANLDRAARGRPLDVAYLASLSPDARTVLTHPRVTGDPSLERTLRAAYCAVPTTGGWRSRRGVGSCARSAD